MGPKPVLGGTDMYAKQLGPGSPWSVCITPDQIRCSMPRMPSRAASTNSAWTEKSGWLGESGKELKHSAGFTKSPARRKRNLRRRIAELARCRTHSASEEVVVLVRS